MDHDATPLPGDNGAQSASLLPRVPWSRAGHRMHKKTSMMRPTDHTPGWLAGIARRDSTPGLVPSHQKKIQNTCEGGRAHVALRARGCWVLGPVGAVTDQEQELHGMGLVLANVRRAPYGFAPYIRFGPALSRHVRRWLGDYLLSSPLHQC